MEGHHVIPMNRQEEYYFDKAINLDVPYNIVPLCPNCHCQIHLGSRRARLKVLSELFVRFEKNLAVIDSEITLPSLASYYNIGLEVDEAQTYIQETIKKWKKALLVFPAKFLISLFKPSNVPTNELLVVQSIPAISTSSIKYHVPPVAVAKLVMLS